MNQPDDKRDVPLTEDTDAPRWAREFAKRFPMIWQEGGALTIKDTEGTMLSWFANAIETGRRAGRLEARSAEGASTGLSSLGMWWVMIEAERELSGEPKIEDNAVVLSFMGSGASHNVTAHDIRDALATRYSAERTINRDPAGGASRPAKEGSTPSAVAKLHSLIDQLAGRFKGYLPWPDDKRSAVVRGHEMFIEDVIRKADAIAIELTMPRTDALVIPVAASVIDGLRKEFSERAAKAEVETPRTEGPSTDTAPPEIWLSRSRETGAWQDVSVQRPVEENGWRHYVLTEGA